VFLTPFSPPSIIGLFGFMGATLMVGAWQANWFGTAAAGAILFPFAAILGGIFQGGAAFPALRARDGLAAAIHATWGSFWIAFGILWSMVVTGVIAAPVFGTVSSPMAFWFIILTLITAAGAFVAVQYNAALAGVLTSLALGSGFTAAGWWSGGDVWLVIGGWLFVVSAVIAWYTATAMVAQNMLGKAVLPLGQRTSVPTQPLQYPAGMPGVKVGQ
jgi:succinate-acetate transporter protein